MLHCIFRSWKFWCGGVMAALLAILAFCSWFNVWSYDEWIVYRYMDYESHPVWREFHYGRIKAGDDIEEVIARTRPSVVKRAGRTVTLEYYADYNPDSKGLRFSGLSAEAEDGKLVNAGAWSCTWVRSFFDTSGDAPETQFPGYRELPGRGAIWVAGD
jgi:hypothetical protein